MSARTAAELVRFGLVGTLGFLVDTAILYAAIGLLGAGPLTGRLLSYLVAASLTWAMNRRFTFRSRRAQAGGRQWAKFVLLNALGGAVNYATYALLVASSPIVASAPVLGVAAGSLAGLGVNFTLSRRFVFGTSPGGRNPAEGRSVPA